MQGFDQPPADNDAALAALTEAEGQPDAERWFAHVSEQLATRRRVTLTLVRCAIENAGGDCEKLAELERTLVHDLGG